MVNNENFGKVLRRPLNQTNFAKVPRFKITQIMIPLWSTMKTLAKFPSFQLYNFITFNFLTTSDTPNSETLPIFVSVCC